MANLKKGVKSRFEWNWQWQRKWHFHANQIGLNLHDLQPCDNGGATSPSLLVNPVPSSVSKENHFNYFVSWRLRWSYSAAVDLSGSTAVRSWSLELSWRPWMMSRASQGRGRTVDSLGFASLTILGKLCSALLKKLVNYAGVIVMPEICASSTHQLHAQLLLDLILWATPGVSLHFLPHDQRTVDSTGWQDCLLHHSPINRTKLCHWLDRMTLPPVLN